MPIYELNCPNCGHRFDELVSSHERVTDVPCPRCGATNLDRMPSLFASAGLSLSSSPPSGGGGGGGCGYGGFT